MRIYNARLGKFLSVDPITAQYPMLTPYQFASNTPIVAIDLDGLEAAWCPSNTQNAPLLTFTPKPYGWRHCQPGEVASFAKNGFVQDVQGTGGEQWRYFWNPCEQRLNNAGGIDYGGYYVAVRYVQIDQDVTIPGTPAIPATPGTPAVAAQSGWVVTSRTPASTGLGGWFGGTMNSTVDLAGYLPMHQASMNNLLAIDAANGPGVLFQNYTTNLVFNANTTGVYRNNITNGLRGAGYTLGGINTVGLTAATIPPGWNPAITRFTTSISYTIVNRQWQMIRPAVPATPGMPAVAATPARTITRKVWVEANR
jgi:hypothetical protein